MSDETIETRMREVRDRLRKEFPNPLVFTSITRDAVIDADEDGDGRLDPNPDTGSGSESGSLEITVHRSDPSASTVLLTESDCTPSADWMFQKAVANLRTWLDDEPSG